MLATIAILGALIHPNVGQAQSNSEYNFRQQEVDDGAHFGTSDPHADLTMNCLAANGFGQWTMSTAVGSGASPYQNGWFLLENALRKPSIKYAPSSNPECIPPGFVSNGTFTTDAGETITSEVEDATNCLGNVCYVSPSSDRASFVVQNLNQYDINIALSGIPNPASTRQISPSTTAHHWLISTGGHNIISSTDEADFHDRFDVKCDGVYLYIVWCSKTNSTHSGNKEIWMTVVALSSGTVVTYPVTFPMSMGDGVRPTVAVDPRYGDPLSPGAPVFDVAYISVIPNGSVVSKTYNSSLTTHTLASFFVSPTSGALIAYSNPGHVRALVSAVKGQSSVEHALYAIVDGANGRQLIFHKPISSSSANNADYVDGAMISPPSPISPFTGTPPQVVVDAPIVAFANPYDNQDGSDQYHCLYQLDYHSTSITHRYPLLVVRGFRNCTSAGHHTVMPSPVSDTRLCLNQNTSGLLAEDPLAGYVGAVNQMGIHIHWRTGGAKHYYARDMNRTFDEDIDEATIVTDTCVVSDGTAHGGTVGATLIKDGRMTVWTDPNYGEAAPDEYSGTYQPRYLATQSAIGVGRLQFIGSNVQLYVGDGSINYGDPGAHYSSATLTVLPYFYFDFLGSDHGAGQGVTINPSSTFEYYGLNQQHHTTPVTTTPFTDGTNDGDGGGTITLQGLYPSALDGPTTIPAYLEVHGGANFWIEKYGALVADYAQIDVLNEDNLYPLNASGSTNGAATGILTLLGRTSLTETSMIGNIAAPNETTIMLVDHGYDGAQFTATNCNFSNSDAGALSILQFGHLDAPKSFSTCLFDGGTGSAVQIHVLDPQYPESSGFTIQGMSFSNLRSKCILMERDAPTTGENYPPILISGNDFGSIGTTPDADGTFGIYLKNYDLDGLLTDLKVQDNTFIYSGNYESIYGSGGENSPYAAAIELENSSGEVLGNIVSDNAYTIGIDALGRVFDASFPRTNSLICNNTVTHLHPPVGVSAFENEVGIRTSYHDGYVKLNLITDCNIGFDGWAASNSHLVFDSITACTLHGIFGAGTLPITIDLSGVHGPDNTGDDYAGFNTVSGALTDLIALYEGVILNLANSLEGWTWSNYGENNFYISPSGSRGTYESIISGDFYTGSGTPNSLQNIDRNFWGSGIDPGVGSGVDPCNWNTNTGYSSEIDAMKVTYNVTTGGTVAETSVPPGRICGVGLTQRKKDDVTPLAPNNPDTISSCQLLYNKAYSYDENALWEKCYDTARLYIDRCASDGSSFNIFGLTDNAVQHYPLGDTTRYRRYREWLESVLYLNTSNPQYFCTCVHSISGTFYQSSDTTHELILEASNRTLAVIRWLIIHTVCDSPFLAQEYADARRSQHDSWLSGDTTIPLDTTLPSIHDLGLDSLLNLHLGVGLSKSPYAGILSSFTISKNPFTSTTTLHFDLDRMVYMRVEVYDELGRIVTGDGAGYSYDPGKHQIPIDLKGFASGAYYLRISLGDGEVRTLKMVKKN